MYLNPINHHTKSLCMNSVVFDGVNFAGNANISAGSTATNKIQLIKKFNFSEKKFYENPFHYISYKQWLKKTSFFSF